MLLIILIYIWDIAMGDINHTTITNSTIAGNSNVAVAANGAYPNMINTIFWGNNGTPASTTDITYSCIEDWTNGGTGNITSDPCFVDASNYNFYLSSVSPCIDVGDSNGDYTGQVDIDGNDRVVDISGVGDDVNDIDMGCYEYSVD